jgi:hypothetical protein
VTFVPESFDFPIIPTLGQTYSSPTQQHVHRRAKNHERRRSFSTLCVMDCRPCKADARRNSCDKGIITQNATVCHQIGADITSPQASRIKRSKFPSPSSTMLFTGTLAALALSNIVSAAIYPVSVPVAADGSGLFSGPQSGIGSWYRASASQDSTSGTGWCGIPYSNSDPVIAVVRLINPPKSD